MRYSKTQIETAKRLGLIAFSKGIKCEPKYDCKLMAMLEDRKAGVTPANEASSEDIMRAWIKSWEEKSIISIRENAFDDPTMTAFDKLLQLLSERGAKYSLKKLSLLSGRKESTVRTVLSKIKCKGVGLVCDNKGEYFIQ